jgi:transposase-like protein
MDLYKKLDILIKETVSLITTDEEVENLKSRIDELKKYWKNEYKKLGHKWTDKDEDELITNELAKFKIKKEGGK